MTATTSYHEFDPIVMIVANSHISVSQGLIQKERHHDHLSDFLQRHLNFCRGKEPMCWRPDAASDHFTKSEITPPFANSWIRPCKLPFLQAFSSYIMYISNCNILTFWKEYGNICNGVHCTLVL